MPKGKRNRKGRKGSEPENRSGSNTPMGRTEDNPRNLTDNASTSGNISSAKYERKIQKENNQRGE